MASLCRLFSPQLLFAAPYSSSKTVMADTARPAGLQASSLSVREEDYRILVENTIGVCCNLRIDRKILERMI